MSDTQQLVLVREDEHGHLAQSPREMAELLAAQRAYAQRLSREGVLHAWGRLRPSRDGARVHGGAGGAPRIERGPSPEARGLAVFYWLRAGGTDVARALASACPVLPSDHVSVRAIMHGQLEPHALRRRGPTFAFVVLGSADSAEAFGVLMDRIDAETRGRLPSSHFLGGARLVAPTEAWRSPHAERDAPLLEAKEVIGGLCFMRLPSLDDAVAWACSSPFVVHGALEVRALWRT